MEAHQQRILVCDYAIDWVQIKTDWDFSATKAEWGALQEILETCDSTPSKRQFRNA